jgi:diguanylate cyclase (GGDEF)-like protein
MPRMPETDVGRNICRFVVRRFLDHDEPTSRRILLKEFKGSLAGPLRKLVDGAALRTVENTYLSETFLPKSTAFDYCGDVEALEVARKSTEAVLRVVQILFDQELDHEGKEQKQFTPTDIASEIDSLGIVDVDAKMIRIGLYLAEEFSIFHTLGRDEKQIFITNFRPTEHIYDVMKDSNPWDFHIGQGRMPLDGRGRSPSTFLNGYEEPQIPGIKSLPNKEKLIADVGNQLRRQAGLALLVIDLDHFKTVNDTKGHPAGDACLERVVKVIASVLGRKGVLYRWGGDEFAVSLPDFSTEEAHATAERIRSAVEQAKPGTDVVVTTSIGVSANDRIVDGSAERLLDAADKAMYASKHQGKNRVTSWTIGD